MTDHGSPAAAPGRKREIVDIVFLGLGRVLLLAFTFLVYKLITNTLSQGEVGKRYLIYSIVNFSAMLFITPSLLYLTRKFNDWNERGRTVTYMFIMGLYICLVYLISVPLILLYVHSSGVDLQPQLLLLLVFLDLFFGTLGGNFTVAFNMSFHRRRFVVYSNLVQYLGLGLALLFTRHSPHAVFWLLGMATGQVIVFFLVVWDYMRCTGEKLDYHLLRSTWRNRWNSGAAVRFMLPVSIATSAGWIQGNYYRFVVEHCIDLEFLALISLGLGLVLNISTSLEAVINQFMIPLLYKSLNTSDSSEFQVGFNRYVNTVLPLYIAAFVFLACFADRIILLLSNPDYLSAARFVIWGVCIEFFRILTGILTHASVLRNRTSILMYGQVGGALLIIAGMYLISRGESVWREAIPMVLATGWAASAALIIYLSRDIVRIRLQLSRMLVAGILSAPLYFQYLVPAASPLSLAALVLAGGLWCLGVQYLMLKRMPLAS